MPDPPTVDEVMRQRTSFVRRANIETYAALALAAATVAALVWANVGDSYAALWSTVAGFSLGDIAFGLPLSDWVDEGLMSLFFFSVGLDVRREVTLGELQHLSRAVLPVVAAVGGLVTPAAVFLLLTHGHGYASAWGAVISTDTAFALGMLALVGPRNAPRLRVFLLTLAVVDDVGALSVIALFCTDRLSPVALGLAALGLVGIWLVQRAGVWRVAPYAVLGVFTWFALYQSGVHATLAGVLIALLMPVYPPRGRDIAHASVFFRLFQQAPTPHTARTVRGSLAHAVPLNQRLSAVLPPYVNYVVVPLFALANARVALSGDALTAVFN
ncbi:Na+/H+ antiporter NhaA [Streptomyces sp. NPDC058373]|uniref:Na+/H+ antiporter NhaA n=1 Tax=Streptomyces sp. NPDC058373 TaxID=3346465 RepID=UPI0036682F4E